MSWQDCFVLGQQLFEMEDYNNTKVWLRESMERLRRHQTQQSALPEPGILNSMEMVAKSLFQMGEHRKPAWQLHAYLLNHFFRRLRHGIRAEPARARAGSIAHTKLASGASERSYQCAAWPAAAAAAAGQHGCEPSKLFG